MVFASLIVSYTRPTGLVMKYSLTRNEVMTEKTINLEIVDLEERIAPSALATLAK